MKIYFSGISGTGLGPLALFAKQAGHTVIGSDTVAGAIYPELEQAGISVHLGPQDGHALKSTLAQGLDWFVYTSALPKDHPELTIAKNYQSTHPDFKVTKRDDFTAHLIRDLGLKLIAVAGTHGKTTTTSMIIYAATKLHLPVSYLVGTTLGFAPSGAYHQGDQFFIYEADEYDRNFLKFHPHLAIIPSFSYDHPDIYPTRTDYIKAFDQFKSQSEFVITPADLSTFSPDDFANLAGTPRRLDAALAATAVASIAPSIPHTQIIDIMSTFPGVGRRFERLKEGIYSDYAHHPEEIAATIATALDEVEHMCKGGLIVIYEPHQNTRQHKIKDAYFDAFIGADHVYWLPTFLTREDSSLPVLTPTDFINLLSPIIHAEPAQLDDELWAAIKQYQKDNYLVLLMTAGPADTWLRQQIEAHS